MDAIIKHLSPAVRKWAKTASPKEIANFLEIGYRSSLSQQIAPDKGKSGELEVEQILSKKFDTKNRSYKGKSGDLLVQTSKGNILVEIKNYNGTVGWGEVEKMYRDIEANRDIKAAIFICLGNGIARIKQSFEFRRVIIQGRRVPICFVSQATEQTILAGIQILQADLKSRIILIKDHTEIANHIKAIASLMGGMSMTRTYLDEMVRSMDITANKMYKTILTTEISISEHIASLERLLDKKPKKPNIKKIYQKLNKKYTIKNPNAFKRVLKWIMNFTNSSSKWHLQKTIAVYHDIKFKFLKSKTDVTIPLQRLPKELTLPSIAKYADGHITLPIRNSTLGYIEEFIHRYTIKS